jgi:hypothetical protein
MSAIPLNPFAYLNAVPISAVIILPRCTIRATVYLALTVSSDLLKTLTGVFWPIAAQAVRHPVAEGFYPQHIVGFALDPR